MTLRKEFPLGTEERTTHTRTHRDWESVPKTCMVQTRQKSQHGEGKVDTAPFLTKKLFAVDICQEKDSRFSSVKYGGVC